MDTLNILLLTISDTLVAVPLTYIVTLEASVVVPFTQIGEVLNTCIEVGTSIVGAIGAAVSTVIRILAFVAFTFPAASVALTLKV